MPNRPDPSKRIFSLRIDRELYRKIEIIARIRGEAVKDTFISLLTAATENITLTYEDVRKIAEETKRAKNGQ